MPGPVCVECGGRLIGWGGYWRRFRHQLAVLHVECGGRLIGWGGYWRRLRHQLAVLQVWVPRRRCRSCSRTQSLLPPRALERRLDAVETIGEAVVRKLSGATIRTTAEAMGLPSTTVRDSLSRYQQRAPALGRGLVAWAVGQGEEVTHLPVDEDRRAAAALGAAWPRLVSARRTATAPGRGGCGA